MDSFSFYKSLYERELKRRHDLEGSLSPILTVLSAIVGILYFFANNFSINFCTQKKAFPSFFLILAVLCFTMCLLKLFKAYNNFFDGFDYKNLSLPTEIRKMELLYTQDEIDYKDYNDLQPNFQKKHLFVNELITRLNLITDHNKTINDERGIHFHKTKTYMILTFIMTVIFCLTIYITR